MAIESITDDCIGCGLCRDSCPADVIRLDEKEKKAVVAYPEDCVLCGWCLDVCPENAVVVSREKTSPLVVSWG
ncbi:ferredoxin family protein [Thermodesulfobacteriota bacterium]